VDSKVNWLPSSSRWQFALKVALGHVDSMAGIEKDAAGAGIHPENLGEERPVADWPR
jgi:hypothetical protein